MKKEIPEPFVSPEFTIDDIHRIREHHYELRKDMTPEERREWYAEGTREFKERIKKIRDQRAEAVI